MKLLTKEIIRKMPPLYANEKLGNNAEVVVKFFTPDSNWTWYATEASAVDKEGNYHKLESVMSDVEAYLQRRPGLLELQEIVFYGLVDGHYKELGFFYLSELLAHVGKLGLPIERDRHFPATRLKELM